MGIGMGICFEIFLLIYIPIRVYVFPFNNWNG
jgi:hypothetical protein